MIVGLAHPGCALIASQSDCAALAFSIEIALRLINHELCHVLEGSKHHGELVTSRIYLKQLKTYFDDGLKKG